MWNRRGLSEALSELLILAITIVVLSALAYFWTNLALPSAKIQLEIKGCVGKIMIYDVAGQLDCRDVRIILQNANNYNLVEVFEFRNGIFTGKMQGWRSNRINSFLNPGDFIILNATSGDYIVSIANSKQMLAQATVKVS